MSLQLSMETSEIILRLLAAAAIGALIGLNRNLHGKPAGLKTHSIVAIGSAAIALAGIWLEPGTIHYQGAEANAISRVIQGVLQGIGFLGAGVILHTERGKMIHGLTSAATIWISAGIGLICGLGIWPLVITAATITFIVLLLGSPVEKVFEKYFSKNTSDDDSIDEKSDEISK